MKDRQRRVELVPVAHDASALSTAFTLRVAPGAAETGATVLVGSSPLIFPGAPREQVAVRFAHLAEAKLGGRKSDNVACGNDHRSSSLSCMALRHALARF